MPGDWLLRRQRRRDDAFDAQLSIGPSISDAATLLVEAKVRVGPRDVAPLVARWTRQGDPVLLVASYLSPRTRELLEAADVNYLDSTGNVRVALRRPPVFIRTQGADSDPWPAQSILRSLRGAAAGRVVRALVDFKPPYGISELAARCGSPIATVHRVIALLDGEGLLERRPRGPVMQVDWQGVLQRWTAEYSLQGSNRVESYLEPRGLDRLWDRLRSKDGSYVVTGSFAAAQLAPVAPPRLAMVFVDRDAVTAAEKLGLTPVDAGANVFLIEPFDPVAFERGFEQDGIQYAAASQVAADLAMSPGRGPSESEALLKWMGANEDAWRT